MWGTSGGIYIFRRSEQFVALSRFRGNWPQAARRPPIYPPPTGSRFFFFKRSGRGRKGAGGAACHAAARRTDPEEGEIPPLAFFLSRNQGIHKVTIERQ